MKNVDRHFPGLVFLTMVLLMTSRLPAEDETINKPRRSLSAFPILMYDTNIGVGYGGKAKFVNFLSRQESLDFIVFNSSGGERWYVFTFSVPDTEIRQGKTYPVSFDLKTEYDKYLEYRFYGVGPDSRKRDEADFIYEKKDLQLTLGRGFTPHLVLQALYTVRNLKISDVQENAPLISGVLRKEGDKLCPFVSILVRYDTSDSQIHPKKGIRLLFQNDWAGKYLGSRDASYHRLTLDLRKYVLFLGQKDVLAFRARLQSVSGSRIPLFELSSLGGGEDVSAMRGYGLNRYLDKGKILVNAEYRFPIWERLGGNIFLDGGCVWPSIKKVDLGKSVFDFGWGLRYYLQNFVVRFDMGISGEGTGIYFNFGHIF